MCFLFNMLYFIEVYLLYKLLCLIGFPNVCNAYFLSISLFFMVGFWTENIHIIWLYYFHFQIFLIIIVAHLSKYNVKHHLFIKLCLQRFEPMTLKSWHYKITYLQIFDCVIKWLLFYIQGDAKKNLVFFRGTL